MRINHNIAALNTHRQLGANNTHASKNLEKLSSGLKINRAGDDAAGLAISEKMRGQIRGLDMAQKNSQDGISLIQTAEGALNETHAILQRMRELAVQSSNDTNTDSDRSELQKEVNQLANALNDISADTEFNTKSLLNGTFEGTFHVGANQGQNLKITIGNMSANELAVATTYTADTNGDIAGLTFKAAAEATPSQTYTADATDGSTITLADGSTATYAAADPDPAGDGSLPATEEGYFNAAGELVLAGPQLAADATGTIAAKAATPGGYYDAAGGLIIEADAKLAADTVVTVGINISNQENADSAITGIQSAIDKVSAERSKLGAVQNRLEHTINNLGTSSENLTAAESRIRDVDYVLAAA
ncbi:flagellin [Lederbergia citrisecunda]|uniref:flagellin N-terminal helical domain-containing protein n=1 Tax=Lederbergia citrisecunda TaxID=2833583 RepID=UPI003D2A0D12